MRSVPFKTNISTGSAVIKAGGLISSSTEEGVGVNITECSCPKSILGRN